MDRTAFKQRMQQLKSYREQNPNKGYLDFKRYAEGGETGYELPEVVVTGRKLDKLKPYGNITDMVTQQISAPKPTTQATPVGQSEDVIITANRVNKPVPFGNFGSMVESPQLPSRLNMIPNQPTTPEPIEPIQEEVINSNPQQAARGSYASDMPIPSMPSMPGTSSMIEPDRLPMEELQQPISPVVNTELGQYDAELSKRRHPNRYNTNFSEERDWLINFAKDRAKLPQFKDQLDKDELTKYIFRVNNTPIMPQDPEMYRGPRNSAGVTKYDLDQYVTYDSPEFYNTGANILLSNDPTYGGNTTPFSTNLNSNALHELDHTTQVSTSRATGSKEGFSKRVQKTADVIGYDLNNAKNSNSNYGNTPWEVLSRRQQLLYDLKSDPTKVYKKKDLKNMRSLLKKYDLNYLGDDKILQLLNDVAANQSQPNNMPDNGIIENRVFHGAKGGEIVGGRRLDKLRINGNITDLVQGTLPSNSKYYRLPVDGFSSIPKKSKTGLSTDVSEELFNIPIDTENSLISQPYISGKQQQFEIQATPLKLANWKTPNKYKDVYTQLKNKSPKGFGLTSVLDLIDLIRDEYEIQKSSNPKQTRRYREYQTRSAIGLEDPGLSQLYSSDPNMVEGGEVPPNKPVIPEDPQPYKGKLVKDRYGKKYTEEQVAEYYNNTTDEIDRFTGGPLVRGMKGAIDLEDAANVTPVGDAISVYDTYNAAKQGDWAGAGLAALTLLPFVPRTGNKLAKPMTVKEFRKKYKGVTPKPKTKSYDFNTTVNKNYAQNRMNEYAKLDEQNLAKRTKAVNQSYNIAERLMDDPDYMARAIEVKKQFGDDYIRPYSDIIQYYNTDPSKLPNVSLDNLGGSRGRMTNAQGKYSYKLDPQMTDLDEFLTEHEYGHYVDLKRNKDRLDAEGDSNMFYQMSKDFSSKPIDSKGYYMKPSEQKSHMNQLREYMFNNGLIKRRGQKVSEKMLEKVLNEVSGIPSLKGVAKASQQFKNMSKYTKWFNSIPLLGVGTVVAYNSKEE